MARLAERPCADEERAPVAVAAALAADKKAGLKKLGIASKSPVSLFGMRREGEPGAPELGFLSRCDLSLCEYMRYWRVELAAFPRSERGPSAAAATRTRRL